MARARPLSVDQLAPRSPCSPGPKKSWTEPCLGIWVSSVTSPSTVIFGAS